MIKLPRKFSTYIIFLFFQGVKEHKCGICGREFTLLANMKRHVLIHTNIRAYQCHLCFKSFVQKQTLKAHMIVHSDVKPFKCKVSAFGSRGSSIQYISLILSSYDRIRKTKLANIYCCCIQKLAWNTLIFFLYPGFAYVAQNDGGKNLWFTPFPFNLIHPHIVLGFFCLVIV